MRILLDTHTLLWFLEDSKRLSRKATKTITGQRNQIFVSDITFFEISIKVNIGKLKLKRDIRSCMHFTMENFARVTLDHEHIVTYQSIACRGSHRDPFDRMLIAIAKHEGMTLLTSDDKFDAYKDLINIIW